MVVGAGVAAGETTTSTLTSTTTLTETLISTVVIAPILVVETSGNIIRGTAAELLIRTERPQTDSEGQHAVIHWPIVKGPPVDNSTNKTAISVVATEDLAATAVELVIVAMQGTDVEDQIAAEAR